MDRRLFLMSTISVLSTQGFFSQRLALAANGGALSQKRLLFVLLRGACDTDSLLYQHGSSFYYKSRPNIAIGREGQDAGLKLDQTWAIHPAASPLMKYIQAGQMAFVPFCGTGNKSRSHFLAQKILEQAAGPNYRNSLQNGLIDRLQTRLIQAGQKGEATCLSRENPEICQGSADIPVLSTHRNSLTRQNKAESQSDQLLGNLYADSERMERYQDYLDAKGEASARVGSQSPMGGSQPKGGGNLKAAVLSQFQNMASLMKAGAGYSLGFLEINGWDTHANQGNETGAVASKLEALCEGLALYAQSMGPAWADCTVLVGTEFGRTFRENGSKGTDHGNASTWMLMSGSQVPAPILGKQLALRSDSLHENRDLPVLNEYRQVMKQLVLPGFGLSAAQLNELLYL